MSLLSDNFAVSKEMCAELPIFRQCTGSGRRYNVCGARPSECLDIFTNIQFVGSALGAKGMKLQELIERGLLFVRDEACHDLPLGLRCRLLSSFDKIDDVVEPHGVGHRRRIKLAKLAVEKVLPLWETASKQIGLHIRPYSRRETAWWNGLVADCEERDGSALDSLR